LINKRLLLVWKDQFESNKLKTLFESWGYESFMIHNPLTILKTIEKEKPQIIVSESKFKKHDALEMLKTLKASYEIPVIFLENEATSIDYAVRVLKNGANDYFSKPIDIVRMKKVLENISSNINIIEESQKLKEQLNNLKGSHTRLIGNSPKIIELLNQIEICAPTDAPVLVTGQSGTGKELVAKAIHELSPRKNCSFIAINCSAIPQSLLESEIFGHEKGSFTGAIKRKEGCFELAHNGTFFLDEITEMAPDLQSKLLRVLENGSFRRIGGTEELSSNVRVLAASNTNINEAIQSGKFRQDLFYRLNVFMIELPPLKDRISDIPLLVQHFIEELNLKTNKNVISADPTVFEILKNYDWPGNIRELRNIVERAVILCNGNIIKIDALPDYLYKKSEQNGPTLTFEIGATNMNKIEQTVIAKTVEHLNGNKAQAAKMLGLSLKTLYNKLNSANHVEESL